MNWALERNHYFYYPLAALPAAAGANRSILFSRRHASVTIGSNTSTLFSRRVNFTSLPRYAAAAGANTSTLFIHCRAPAAAQSGHFPHLLVCGWCAQTAGFMNK
jgi:hypothetical protein